MASGRRVWFEVACACLLAGPVAAQPATPACAVRGTITSAGQALPGVAVVAAADGHDLGVTSTALDGRFAIVVPGAGRYSVRADLPGFAPLTRDVTVDASCLAVVDFTLTLQSRVAATATTTATATETPAPAAVLRVPRRVPMRPAFQTLAVTPERGALDQGAAEDATAEGRGAALEALAAQFAAPGDSSLDAVTAYGRASQLNEFLPPDQRGEGRFPGDGFMPPGGPGNGLGAGESSPFAGLGGPGLGGGFGPDFGGQGGAGGAQGGGPGGFGGFGGAFGRRGNNRLTGSLSYTLGGSALDAAPYDLNGRASNGNADYLTQRIAASVGGALKIPGVYDGGQRTSFFVNYAGNHSSSLSDTFSTVPTRAERNGDLSSVGAQLVDPATGQPFANNQIPASRLAPSAVALLPFIPMPNIADARLNYRFTTTTLTGSDDVNLRVTHRFGELAPNGRGGAAGAPGSRGGAGAAGARGGLRSRGGATTLSLGINYRHLSSDLTNPFATLGGTRTQHAWNVPATLAFSKGGLLHSVRVGFNRNQSRSFNTFAYTRDVAGEAGILGVSTDPFDWGMPGLSFSSITDVRDVAPTSRVDQRLEIGDTVVKQAGRQTWRLGGNYRELKIDSRTDRSAAGTFVFTGLYSLGNAGSTAPAASGADFADFLLGTAQQASVQFGPGLIQLRGRAWNLFVQDDWRASATLTINAGLRYDYVSPFREAQDRLVNLDVAPEFSAVVPVEAGETGPYYGTFPAALVHGDHNNLAPRVGVAWRAASRTIVRTGYGINYSENVYAAIAQRLAAQPPFAVSATSLGTLAVPVLLATPLANVLPDATTNTFGIDPHFALGLAQIWNLEIQHTFGRTGFASIGYVGTRGSSLDLQRAPNRGPTGLLVDSVPAFVWETAQADSILHSLTVRLRRRLANGWSAGGSYTFSKSIDDASSIGGTQAVVAQNDADLGAERGLSSFDRRHQLNADAIYELPFGTGRRWLNRDGLLPQIVGGWQASATLSYTSGAPYTARVLGSATDVGGGTNGTLRADVTGAPVAVADPSIDEFFNVGAFAVPAIGTFGDAGRNTIIGPGSALLNGGLTKNVTLGGRRILSIRAQATNLLNDVQFAAIDTVVNSPTFGQVVSVRPMRSVQIIARLRF